MKKYFLSLLILTLFLSNFSSLAMKKQNKPIKDLYIKVDPEHERINYKKFCELPDDVIIYVILLFLDTKSLTNILHTNIFFRKRVIKALKAKYLDISNFRNCTIRQFAGDQFKCERIKNLVKKIETILNKNKNLFLFYEKNNTLKLVKLDNKNMKRKMFNIFTQSSLEMYKKFLSCAGNSLYHTSKKTCGPFISIILCSPFLTPLIIMSLGLYLNEENLEKTIYTEQELRDQKNQ